MRAWMVGLMVVLASCSSADPAASDNSSTSVVTPEATEAPDTTNSAATLPGYVRNAIQVCLDKVAQRDGIDRTVNACLAARETVAALPRSTATDGLAGSLSELAKTVDALDSGVSAPNPDSKVKIVLKWLERFGS